MWKRAMWVGLLLIGTQFASGCCWFCHHRPFLFRRAWEPAYFGGHPCCYDGTMPATVDYAHPPTMGPAAPGTMPRAQDLTRR